MPQQYQNYYHILRVPFDATTEEIKCSYRKLAKVFHPDQGGSEEEFKKINEAYGVLSNEVLRKEYDIWYAETYHRNAKKEEPPQKQVVEATVYNVEMNSFRVQRVSVNIAKFPPSIYSKGGYYYVIERLENGKNVMRVYQMEKWYTEIEKSKSVSSKNVIVKIGRFFRQIIEFLLRNIRGVIIVAIIIAGICGSIINNDSSDNLNESVLHSTAEEDLADYVEKAPPAHGTTAYSYDEYESSIFEIKLPHNDEMYYYIKLIDVNTGRMVQDVFMNPGTSIEISVPCGSFRLKYACGEKWYGYRDTFGPYGGYSQSDDVFDFTYEYGHTVTLYPVTNGNMETESIDYYEF